MLRLSRARFALVLAMATVGASARAGAADLPKPLVIARQGSFFAGGATITAANGQALQGDHAYVQYQIPPQPRQLPLVMWHGGGQSGKSWESTPDGREGFQSIFLRRGFSVYIIDQPRMGRAGRATVGTTIEPVGNGATLWNIFRLGVYPDFYPNVQFSRDPPAVDQFLRQQISPTGTLDRTVNTAAITAALQATGPAVLLTHSASGLDGWLTAIKSLNVRAVIAYEPTGVVFPSDEVPAAIPLFGGKRFPAGREVSRDQFARLTQIPIQIVFGDNIPTVPSPPPVTSLDLQRAFRSAADLFVAAINARGGDASVLRLPEAGLVGNTHFPFSDLNNVAVADLLAEFLHQKGLDARPARLPH